MATAFAAALGSCTAPRSHDAPLLAARAQGAAPVASGPIDASGSAANPSAGDAPHAADGFSIPVSRTTLANGLTVLVHEDRSAPLVSVYIFYRSGSRNERPGITGIAHLFEHMMFNGGINTEGKFDEVIEHAGGSTNGYTTRDYTAYLENFPAPALERVLWLEADRMAALAITEKNLEQERGIVMEERRLRVDNSPGGKLYEELYLAAYEASTYRWNTIGFMADIRRTTLEDAREYFHTYYAPNNAILVMAGAVSQGDGFALAERYFGGIPRHEPPAKVSNQEPQQQGPKRIEHHKVAQLPLLAIAYHAVPATHPDRPALDVLETILSDGESARMYRALVRGKELATGVSVELNWGIDAELFWIFAQARPGKSVPALERAIHDELAKVRERAPDEAELRKAKNLLLADYVRGLKTVSGKANQIGFYEVVFGDYAVMFDQVRQWEAVTPEDVRRVARTYLVDASRTTVELVPKRGGSAAPKAAAAPQDLGVPGAGTTGPQ